MKGIWGRCNVLEKIIDQILKLERELRENFARTLIQVEDEISLKEKREFRFCSKDIELIDLRGSFKGINIWELAYQKYKQILEEEGKKIYELNNLVNRKGGILWKDLLGLYGYIGGYHEIIVHKNDVFDSGNSGSMFIDNLKRLKGVFSSNKTRKPFWRSTLSLQNFCIAYYRLLFSSEHVRNHFRNHKEDFLEIGVNYPEKVISPKIDRLLNLLGELPKQNFNIHIEEIFSLIKEIVKMSFTYYPKIVIETLVEVNKLKRIKQLYCRVYQGPLLSPYITFRPYPRSEIIKYHENTDEIRRYFYSE